jgi:ubiquinone/menaquinone biosynthesis C-methylase UbiE
MGFYSDYIFPKFYDFVVKHKVFDPLRENILSAAEGNILEIGIGTGLNLELYPKQVTEITAIDPNPGMERELKDRLKKRRVQVHFFRASAESLPFDDQSFQTVVSTLTMCTIPDLQKALAEIRRVLKPTGKFLFLEHGLSRDARVANLQFALNPLQRRIGCGCQLTVDVEQELRKAGLEIHSIKQYYVPKAPKFIGSVYEGVATSSAK